MESIKGNSNFHRTKALYIQIPQDKMPTQQHSLVHYVIKWFLAQKKKCYCVQNCCFSAFKYELLSFLSNEFIKNIVIVGYQNFT